MPISKFYVQPVIHRYCKMSSTNVCKWTVCDDLESTIFVSELPFQARNDPFGTALTFGG